MAAPVVRPVGRRAVLVELSDLSEVRAAYDELVLRVADGRLPGVVDVVPGARTVLLDGLAPDSALRSALPAVVAAAVTALAAVSEPSGPPVDVPVSYDGPDLGDVARMWGCSPEDVVSRHTDVAWTVAFCGFAPGFGYLSGLPASLAVPRRDRPREQVPAGAVGLAGEFSGVYPRASPGGWQLIGSTSLPVWDADRDPPALLSPGTRVRFHSVEQ